MSSRRVVLALALVLTTARGPLAAPAKPAEPAPPLQNSLLNQIAEVEKWQGEQIWHIKEQVDALPGLIDEAKEGHTATQEEVGKLRDEVKGLYVELSSVRQQIDGLKDEIGGVNTNVSGFRTYSGFFLALMLLMVAIIFFTTIRR